MSVSKQTHFSLEKYKRKKIKSVYVILFTVPDIGKQRLTTTTP